jgi:hypothetical protein
MQLAWSRDPRQIRLAEHYMVNLFCSQGPARPFLSTHLWRFFSMLSWLEWAEQAPHNDLPSRSKFSMARWESRIADSAFHYSPIQAKVETIWDSVFKTMIQEDPAFFEWVMNDLARQRMEMGKQLPSWAEDSLANVIKRLDRLQLSPFFQALDLDLAIMVERVVEKYTSTSNLTAKPWEYAHHTPTRSTHGARFS